ncbi:MAG: type IV pilus modification PilV family protein [Microthrixaceae bacterium]
MRCSRGRQIELRKRRRGQAGYSLVEAVAAIALSGTVVLAVISCVLTLVYSAGTHRRAVRSGIEATDIAEQIDRLPYVPCAGSSAYSAAINSLTIPGYSAQFAGIEHLQSRTAATASFTTTSCSNPADDQGVQRLTVQVTATGKTDVTEDLVFVKRNSGCPAGTDVGVTC